MNKIVLFEEMFLKGRFKDLRKQLQTYATTSADDNAPEIPNYENNTFSWILENNINVTTAMEYITSDQIHQYEYECLFNDFYNLHLKMKTVEMVICIPINLQLTVTHNILWLTWMKITNLKHDFEIASKCVFVAQHALMKAISSNTSFELSADCWFSSKCVSQLVKNVKDNLNKVTEDLTLQLLEILSLLILILLERKDIHKEDLVDILDVFVFIKNSQKQLSLQFNKRKAKYCEDNTSPKIFKFSLLRPNSHVDELNPSVVFFMISVVGYVVSVRLDQWEQSLDFLNAHRNEVEESCSAFSGLWYFLKAYSYYQNDELLECENLVTHALNFPIGYSLKVRLSILHSVVLEENGLYMSAIEILSKSENDPVSLFQMALCYEMLISEVEKGTSSVTYVMQDLKNSLLNILHELVNVLSINSKIIHSERISFTLETRILDIVFFEPEITLSAALYKLARLQYQNKNLVEAVVSLEKLVSLLLKGEELIWSSPTAFPSQREIVHELALILVRTGQLQKAKNILSELSVDCDISDTIAGISGSNVDVIALMLLAKISNVEGDYIGEADLLDRCLNGLTKAKSSISSNTNGKSIIECLKAKAWMQRGLNCLKRNCREDSKHLLTKALLCNKEDSDVLYHYCVNNTESDGYTVWKQLYPSCKPVCVLEDMNITLQFILQDTVTLIEKNEFTINADCFA